MMMPGLISRRRSYERFHFSNVPARKFSTMMSDFATSCRKSSWPSSSRRFRVTERLLRPTTGHHSDVPSVRPHCRIGSPAPGASTLMTSAPWSAISVPAKGPASSCPASITRTPASGPVVMGRSYIRYGLRMSEVQIVEVSPRDGLQNESRLVSTEHKAQLVRRALDAGLTRVEVTAFAHPERVPQMADAEAVMAEVRDDPRLRSIGLVR